MPKSYKEKESLVKRLREYVGLLQKDLAYILEVEQPMVSTYENFKKMPSQRVAERLVKFARLKKFKLTLKMLENDYK